MARRLEKIEKEMGYCDVKLEKERRLRKQIEFINADLAHLKSLIGSLGEYAAIVQQPNSAREGLERPTPQAFNAAGLLDLVGEKEGLLERERQDLLVKLRHYHGFGQKKRLLEDERRSMFRALPAASGNRLRQISEEFKRIERQWNGLSEDIINLDEGLFFFDRNLDYLKSCRNFLLAARGEEDFENWRSGGFLADLFRHTNVGRAVEMADGADWNLRQAQKEFVCITTFKVRTDNFCRVVPSFMEALFGDLFVESHVHGAIAVIERAIAENEKLLEQVRARREQFTDRLDRLEKTRGDLFSRMGFKRESDLTV